MLLKLMSNRAKKPEHETRTDLNKIFFGRKSFKINKGKSEQWLLSRFDTILKINRMFLKYFLHYAGKCGIIIIGKIN